MNKWLVAAAIFCVLLVGDAWLGAYLDLKWTGAVLVQGFVFLMAAGVCVGMAFTQGEQK